MYIVLYANHKVQCSMFNVQSSMSFRWLNELTIDVASHASGNNHPDGVDTYQPYQKGGEDRNPAVDERNPGALG